MQVLRIYSLCHYGNKCTLPLTTQCVYLHLLNWGSGSSVPSIVGVISAPRDSSDGRVTARDALHRVTSNMSHLVAWSRSREDDCCHEARNNVCDVSCVMCDV